MTAKQNRYFLGIIRKNLKLLVYYSVSIVNSYVNIMSDLMISYFKNPYDILFVFLVTYTGESTSWTFTDGRVVGGGLELWGPTEPSGDGECGSFLAAGRWDEAWLGLGFRWNDAPCDFKTGYICKDPSGK